VDPRPGWLVRVFVVTALISPHLPDRGLHLSDAGSLGDSGAGGGRARGRMRGGLATSGGVAADMGPH